MSEHLIDRIYECSVVPELWPGVLDELAAMSRAQGGLLFAVRDRVLNWTASQDLEEVFTTYVNDGWFRRCSRRVCLFSSQDPGFCVEHDFWTEDELAANPIYRDFFRPRGLGWSAGTGVPLATGDNIVFSVERRFDDGPVEKSVVERLNALRPHLSRSAFISARLGLQRASGASETLTALGLPTALLDAGGSAVAVNSLMEALSDHVKWRAKDRFSLKDAAAQAHLQAALDALAADKHAPVLSFPVRDETDTAAMVAHLIPVSRTARDVFSRSYLLLTLTPVRSDAAPSAHLIRALFDLTAAEARVARGLAAGQSLEEIAAEGGVALSTVRWQLRQIHAKTGCTRQGELVALMANIAIGR